MKIPLFTPEDFGIDEVEIEPNSKFPFKTILAVVVIVTLVIAIYKCG